MSPESELLSLWMDEWHLGGGRKPTCYFPATLRLSLSEETILSFWFWSWVWARSTEVKVEVNSRSVTLNNPCTESSGFSLRKPFVVSVVFSDLHHHVQPSVCGSADVQSAGSVHTHLLSLTSCVDLWTQPAIRRRLQSGQQQRPLALPSLDLCRNGLRCGAKISWLKMFWEAKMAWKG